MVELEWGQTPWDNKTREELLLEVKRMYSAITALDSVAHLCRAGQEASPFWHAQEGSGARALELARQILIPIHTEYEREDIYRCYFRYARDLLFEDIGSGWHVCRACGGMIGLAKGEQSLEGVACIHTDCGGTYSRLTWEDLEFRPTEGKE